MKNLIITGLLVGATTFNAFANTDLYVGVKAGKAKFDTGISVISWSASLSENDTAYGIFVGYKINDYVSTELEYNDFGKAEFDFQSGVNFKVGNTTMASGTAGSLITDAKSYGAAIALKYPLHEYFNPYVKFGYHKYKLDVSFNNATVSVKTSDSGNDTFYGLGFESKISDKINARLSQNKYSFEKNEDIKVTALSLIYNF